MKKLACLAAVLVLATAPLSGAELGKAKQLAKIGDYAAALTELHALATADPENAEVRLVMASCFANCAFDLKMPGPMTVGNSNAERAMYELGILLKLGDTGRKAFLGIFDCTDPKLVPPAIQVAVREKCAEAGEPILKLLDRADADPAMTGPALNAVGQLRPPKTAETVRKLFDREKDDGRKRWLAFNYFSCLDDNGLVGLAESEKDPIILDHLVQGAMKTPASVWPTLARRTDLPAARRVDALRRCPFIKDVDKSDLARLLTDLLADKAPEVAWAATQQLARTEPEKAMKSLVAALADKKTAQEAMQTLSDVKSKAAVAPLLQVLEEKNDPKRFQNWVPGRQQVYWLLVNCGAEGADLVRAVRLMLVPDPAEGAVVRPVRMNLELPNIPRERAAAVLAELITDKDLEVRRAAARQAVMLDTKDNLELGLKMLDDKDADIRHQGERVVLQGARTGKVKADVLGRLLKSDDQWIVHDVVSVAVTQADKEMLEPMLDLLKDEKRAGNVMDDLLKYFAAVPDARAVEPIVKALLNEQQSINGAAAGSALKMCAKNSQAVAWDVAAGLASKANRVRTTSAVALKALGDKSVLADLVEASKKAQGPYERGVLEDAIRSLSEQK